MLGTDQSHLRKYLATLGVAIIAGVVTVSGLFLRLQTDLLVSASDLSTLTPRARETIERRQFYIDLATTAMPWFLLAGCVVGLSLTAYGIVGWGKRQRVADELEDIARDRGQTELRQLTDSERVTRLEREIETSVAEAEGRTTSVEPLPPPTGQPSNDESVARSPLSAGRARAFHRTMEAELQLAIAVEQLLGAGYSIDIGVEIKRGTVRREFDLVATSRSTARRYVFELKYLSSFGKNFRFALASGITAAAAGASMLGGSAVPVVVIVYDDDPGVEQQGRAQEYANQLAATFASPPRVVFLSLEALHGADLTPLVRALDL